MQFQAASERARGELNRRLDAKSKLLRFGLKFLDDAMLGIRTTDLVLIGAPSGVGKTQLCCQIALANLEDGKTVHYIALEAEEDEIERRMKYQIFATAFYGLPSEMRRGTDISYDNWVNGAYVDEWKEIEDYASKTIESGYSRLFTYYKTGDFGVPQMIELIVSNAKDTDLFIIDHVHYFDFDDDNENRAIKEIAKTARTLALEEQKPIILVSHLRKRDKGNSELVAGLDEFHGSSDLAKIATKVVTLAPGSVTSSGMYETFFRTPKNRTQGSVTRYAGRVLYDSRTTLYGKTYKVGLAGLTRTGGFEELAHAHYPQWAYGQVGSGAGADDP